MATTGNFDEDDGTQDQTQGVQPVVQPDTQPDAPTDAIPMEFETNTDPFNDFVVPDDDYDVMPTECPEIDNLLEWSNKLNFLKKY